MIKNKVRILLVEADEKDYILTRDLLEKTELYSVRLEHVSSYPEGLKTLKEKRFDLLITAYHLGGHTGIDLIKKLQVLKISLPAIVLTYEKDLKLDQQALKAGAVDFLVKQEVTSSILERSIRYSLAQHLQFQKMKREVNKIGHLDSAERHTHVLETISDIFFTLDDKWRILFFNEKAKDAVGKSKKKVLEKVIWELYPDMVGSAFYKKCYEVLETKKPVEFEEEDPKKKRWYLIKIYPLEEGISVFFSNITHYKKSEEQARYQALYDSLTGLPNRVLFEGRLTQELLNAKDSSRKIGVLFLDLDRFKIINDTLGHESGDILVNKLAKRLLKLEKSGDMVARFGGDEFLIMISSLKKREELSQKIEQIFEALTKTFMISGQEIHVNTSLGIAVYPEDGDTPQALIKNADTALHRAKDAGRNTYSFYQPSMHLQSAEHLTLENDLRRAITNNEFIVYYQPIIDSETCKVHRCEALLRWNHPQLGIIFPNEFIPLAEESGAIYLLSEWTLKTVCGQIEKWKERGVSIKNVAVNISAREFSQPNFLSRVKRIAEQAKLSLGDLEIELTESIAMYDIETTISRLLEMKKMGIQIAIDDFGTGHSSLNYLKRLPLDRLKIDKSFTRNCIDDLQDQAIVSAIVSMGHSLGLQICAEGIENHQQSKFLTDLGCESLQGFFFSKSLPAKQLEEWLQKYHLEFA